MLALVMGTAGCDWTMFGAGPAHTRDNASETAIGVANVATLANAWTEATGGAIGSSPAVANGVVYVGSTDGKLYAYSLTATCVTRAHVGCPPVWTATTGGAVISSPAVVNGVVYVGSYDGKLYAFDAAGSTGCSGTPKVCAPLWTASTINSHFSPGIFSSPVVVNGVVYVGSENAGTLYAFDAAGSTGCSGTPKTCKPLWTAATGAGIDSSPAVANGVVYVGSEDHDLYAFDAAGSTGCSGTPKTCTPLWTAATGAAVDSSPAVANGEVFVGSYDGKVYAFDATGSFHCSGTPKTCTPEWVATTGDAVLSSPAVANGVVYVGSDDGKLYAFAANCLHRGGPNDIEPCPLWTATTGAAVFSSPAVANGVVYVGSADHNLYAFDAAGSAGCTSSRPITCTALWSATTGDVVFSSPAVANGVVYVGSYDAKLYAFRLP
jgi:outer membrane protein assembly factor BamB